MSNRYCFRLARNAPISQIHFVFGITLYMFRAAFPSTNTNSRLYIQHQVYVQQVLLPGSNQVIVSVWHIPVAVCTAFNSWWWTERSSETCRVLFQNKINLRYCASGWFYYGNILRCTALWTPKKICCLFSLFDVQLYKYLSSCDIQ